MSSIKARHTIILSGQDDHIAGIALEKGWWVYDWITAWDWRIVVLHKGEEYYFVGHTSEISLARATAIVERIAQGKIQMIDLRQYNTRKPNTAEKR